MRSAAVSASCRASAEAFFNAGMIPVPGFRGIGPKRIGMLILPVSSDVAVVRYRLAIPEISSAPLIMVLAMWMLACDASSAERRSDSAPWPARSSPSCHAFPASPTSALSIVDVLSFHGPPSIAPSSRCVASKSG